MNEHDDKAWKSLWAPLPKESLKPLSGAVYGVNGLTDVNEAFLVERLWASGLPWEWRIVRQEYLGFEDRTGLNGTYRVYLASIQGVLHIDGREFHGAGAHDNKKLDAAMKGAATVAFKNACKWAGMTIELFKGGKAMDFIAEGDEGSAQNNPHTREAASNGPGTAPPPTSRHDAASSSAPSPAPPKKRPEAILAETRGKLAKTDGVGYDRADAVCPSCGHKDALRPAGNPRFCAKGEGGCGFPNSKRGETFSLISYGEWLDRQS